MNRPWSLIRRRTRRSVEARTLGRTTGRAGEFVHPADPPLAPRLDPQRARDGVRQAITEMHQQGAIDAGNGDVLDPWIDALEPQWAAHQVMAGADREAVAQLAAARYEAEAAAARERAEATKAERAGTERLLAVFERQLVTPHENGTPAHGERRRRSRPAVDSLEGLTRDHTWTAISAVLLLLAAAGDVVNFYVTIAGMMPEAYPFMLVSLTAAVTAAAIGLMHVAGRTARNLREGQGGIGRVLLAVIVLVWAGLGAAAFFIRTRVTPPATVTGDAAFGADPGSTAATPNQALLSAILLGTLFLGSGLLAYWIGFSQHHPRMKAYRSLRTQLARQRADAARAEKAAVLAERRYATARAEIERTRKRAAAGQASVDAEIAELKELARIHMAGLLGDPAATNNLTTGRADDAAARPASPSRADALELAARFEVPRPAKNGPGRRAAAR